MATLSFNLVDEPWIPCVRVEEQQPHEVSLREVLVQAHEFRELIDPSPLVTVAVHRLLLAVLHRVFGPESPDVWDQLWERKQWDAEVLNAYLDRWKHRFDLFDAKRPFYQVPDLDFERYERPITALVLELNLADRTLFEHTTDDKPPQFDPARAGRELIAHQSVALGGLMSFDDSKHRSGKGAPLAKGALVLVKGKNVFETLMLNLHWYSPAESQPFESEENDLPAWERGDVAQPDARDPTGYVDYLTWQSRRIRLHPEVMPGGEVGVQHVIIMKGYALPESWNDSPQEPMLAYRRVKKARGKQNPWDPITFRPDRAFWRDSLPLFQSLETDQREFKRSKMLNWLADLSHEYGYLERSQTQTVDVYGMSSDRQKIFLWRHERFPLPLIYLEDIDLFNQLRNAVNLAEEVGRALRSSIRTLAWFMLAPDGDLPDGREPDRNAVTAFVDSIEATRIYWARLDTLFGGLLVNLANDRQIGKWGIVSYGDHEMARWRAALRETATGAFEETIRSFAQSARGLKAMSRAQRAFRIRLAKALNTHTEQEDTDGRAA